MEWIQKEIRLLPKPRGVHLVTSEIVGGLAELKNYHVGIAHFFLQHSSASLSINENADPSVRRDMEAHFNHLIPQDAPYFEHTYEGPDDMPAHLKNVCIGTAISIPITDGHLNLGTWQGYFSIT